MYLVFLFMDCIVLNIMLFSYDQNLEFGLIVCCRIFFLMQCLLDFIENGIYELEVVVDIC